MASPTIKPKKMSFLPNMRSGQKPGAATGGQPQDAPASGEQAQSANFGGIFCFLRVFKLASMMTQTGC